jgi:hypothetical protein
MQMKDDLKRPRRWKVLAGVGTAAAIGLAGIAFANPGDAMSAQSPITLQSQTTTSQSVPAGTTPSTVYVNSQDDVDCSLDDCSSDSADCASADSSPDTADDASDSVDCSIDS